MSRPLVDIRLEGLGTRGGPGPDLADVSAHVRYGEFFTIVGPPGSGKSAVLRAIAGFQPLAAGRVVVDGRDLAPLPPGRRGIGVVFQDGALWPHLSVAQHVAFGLRAGGRAGAEVDRRVGTVAGRLGLAAVLDRRPGALTLDQRRRLALARALAPEPRILLLDEPLAHLDPLARKALRLELARLHGDLAVTTVCATRDATDALALSHRVAVMVGGRFRQVGDPQEVYRRPASRAAALALGPAAFLPVRVVEVRELGVVAETEGGDRLPVAGLGAFGPGDRGLLVLRPDLLGLTEAATARGPGIPGQVALRLFEGARHVYEVDVRPATRIRVELPAGEAPLFRVGDRVRVEVGGQAAVLIPPEEDQIT